MKSSEKRPVLVWLIFLWFVVTGIFALYQLYALYSGNIEIPAGMEKPEGVLYYFKGIFGVVLAVLAATLLFLRKSASRWLFLGLFIFTVVSGVFTLFTHEFPENQFTLIKYISVTTWIIYGLIVWYVFTLEEKDYFVERRT
ncbi:hypothetical protein [Microbulbifer hydrolyticus]|uniref:Glucose dehydrogenase n=1 Tax=Microbulbifer hydrolyticus TaxID=48074 RepID=A0A6P1T8Y7_9GAMM|nr:hypothetical protein [Microbulbifer hydrolyticus]MBB5213243.1 glucose dehydrogenase [Microbulbifer hydrolyticus]QHQ38497.1 hypothetical protein GTQ55_05475 [Microbulbifer hydrolyticus]